MDHENSADGISDLFVAHVLAVFKNEIAYGLFDIWLHIHNRPLII